MLSRVYDYVRRAASLKSQVDKNTEDIRQLRDVVDELADVVKELKSEMRIMRESHDKDCEILVLRLRNELLEFERRLPLGGSDHGKLLE